MTEPRETQRDRNINPGADRQPEVNADVIQDLDVVSDDDDYIRGGQTCNGNAPGVALPYSRQR